MVQSVSLCCVPLLVAIYTDLTSIPICREIKLIKPANLDSPPVWLQKVYYVDFHHTRSGRRYPSSGLQWLSSDVLLDKKKGRKYFRCISTERTPIFWICVRSVKRNTWGSFLQVQNSRTSSCSKQKKAKKEVDQEVKELWTCSQQARATVLLVVVAGKILLLLMMIR